VLDRSLLGYASWGDLFETECAGMTQQLPHQLAVEECKRRQLRYLRESIAIADRVADAGGQLR
jgi:hypothetical protein